MPNIPMLTAAGLSIVAATYGLARYCFGLFLPEIRDAFNLSSQTIGLIAGSSYVGYLTAIFLSAWLSALFGPRLPVILGGTAATVGMLLIALAQTPFILVLGVFVAGMSPGLAYPPFSDVIVRHIEVKKQNTVYAWINSGTGFGVALAGPLALYAGADWRIAWFAFAALALVVTVWNGLVIPVSKPAAGKQKTTPLGYFFTLKNPAATGLFITALLFGVVTAIYWTYAVDLLRHLSSDSKAGIIFWVTLGVSGIFGCFAGEIVNALGLKLAYQTLVLIVALAIGTLPLIADTVLGIYLSAAFFGVGFIAATAIFGIWSMQLYHDHPSIGFGATFFLISLGQGIGPIMGGFLSPIVGQSMLFNIVGIVCAGLICCFPSHRKPV